MVSVRAASVVVITGRGLEHRFVVNTLLDALGDAIAAVLLPGTRRSTLRERVDSYRRRYSPRQLASRAWARAYAGLTHSRQNRQRVFRRMLGLVADRPLPTDLLRVVPTLNGPEMQEVLTTLRPDIIAVFGTGIVRPPIIRLATKAILNMHTGISPTYRGSDTVFWPLYNAEPEWVGVTIHRLDEGVDTGPVLKIGRPEIEAVDTEDTLFCKCIQRGSQLYADAVREVANGSAAWEDQALETGRQYRFVDRTVAAERKVRRLLRGGLLRRYVASRGP